MIRSHKEIRTYSFADKAQQYAHFALKRIEDIYNASNGTADSPHRHDYYTIIFIEKASGKHYIDFTEFQVEDSSVFFIVPGQMHQLVLDANPLGWVISFTDEFLIKNAIPARLINEIFLFNEFGQSPPLPIHASDLPVYKSLIEQMAHFADSLEFYTTEAVGALVKLFLIQSNNHCSLKKKNNPQLVETGNHLLRSFKQLLNQSFRTAHQVGDYASELAVTSDYLNKTVKSLTGHSAKDHIQHKITLEAKRALLFSPVSNKELAFELGFDEPAHFNNFFKKMTSLTPSEFRNSLQ